MLHSTLHRVLIFTYKKFKYYVVIIYTNINTIMPPIAYLISPPSSPSKSSSPSSPSSRTTTRYISSSPLLPTYNNRREEDVDVEVDIEEEDDDWENIDIDYYQCDERRKERRSSTANSAVRYVKAIQKVAQRYGGGCMSGTERRLMERLVKEKRG